MPTLASFELAGKRYFHLELLLGPDDLIGAGPMAQRELAYRFSDGGQFEIYIRPELVPVPSPDCAHGVIVRMPWTNPNAPNAKPAVETKQRLFRQIMQLRDEKRAAQRVVLQLNPYIDVSPDDPPRVSLTQCTVFFRHAHEEYVDQLGPLSP